MYIVLQGSKTPLHLAAENGMTDAMDYLISAKCNKLARTSVSTTIKMFLLSL